MISGENLCVPTSCARCIIHTWDTLTFIGYTNIGHTNIQWISKLFLDALTLDIGTLELFMTDMTSFSELCICYDADLYLNPQILLRGPQLLGNEQPM